ncbi:3-oxoadipate enol-lactonase 2 [Fulvia fulva]|uniref:3-oxoadipate enol-lactonase 2 n=1 Tax=Passalora fulva TaxID=5499 RepID=A0A9Q8L8F1_PASFU|nr:3-oxoadipate enol-lactonase 2 [Fulvia fulva]KAK4634551.1 3-oxoadipate enol-lactonase 2 [Fulvia fulva]KAK4638396.1 3-oxoadipate enol-lactonase 2 [Fulvia fulva]UJO12800.1 3-oxoadipate enol-lactonase 2 [Fulvia fulva]WPV09477.1 3-oxoadipate enol-lactonase 2 [Fulvia fulva]WPV23892.1 3-oxoadipate enol-lactonase 2 [Fulvia fulva]
MEGPGYLAVAIQPGWNTDEAIFHDWYNTEHGPLRLRLPFIQTGDRYKATDQQTPEWSAVYDVSDLSWLQKRIYTRLREERSLREKAVMSTFESLDRKIYSLISTRGEYNGPPAVTRAVSLRVNEADLDEFNRWYEEEHIDMLSKVPGWLRTRRFRMQLGSLQGMPPSGQVEILAVHDFSKGDALDGAEWKAATSTPWRNKMIEKALWRHSRTWSHYFTFDALEEPPSSVITTDDAELRFQLEGNPADPVIVCVNSILTNLHIWDEVSKALIAGINGKTYRVLRYNSRGYAQQSEKSNHTSFDILADDLEYLLQRLNVEKVHAVIGVSMGGVAAINFAIRHPDMLKKYVACDCNVASSPANSQAWAERVELAKTKGISELAKITVERWFTLENHESVTAKKVLPMAEQANLQGFEQNSLALSKYDLKPRLGDIKSPGLLIAGESDGKIPEVMQNFGIANTSFKSIPKAGHLPFLENHDAFVAALGEFL